MSDFYIDFTLPDAIIDTFTSSLEVGRPDLPTVIPTSGTSFTLVDPFTMGKDYEVLKVMKYNPALVPAESELSAIHTRGANPRTIVAVNLNYAEVSDVYLGSDGEYYVATIARLYVPVGSPYFKMYDGNLQENFRTLSLPGSRMYPGKFSVEFEDTFAASVDDFVRFRLATAEEIAGAVANQSKAMGRGWLLNPDGTMSPPDKCFPAHTRIQTSRTTSTAISALRVGDVVLAYDSRADNSRGLSRLGMAG